MMTNFDVTTTYVYVMETNFNLLTYFVLVKFLAMTCFAVNFMNVFNL